MNWRISTPLTLKVGALAGLTLACFLSVQAGQPAPSNGPNAFTTVRDRLVAGYKLRTIDSCKPTAPVQAELKFAAAPQPGQPVQLLLNVMPMVDGPNADIMFDVPTGIRVLSGLTSRRGLSLRSKEVYQYPIVVSIDQPGDFVVRGSAVMGEQGQRFGRRQALYIHATAGGIQVSDTEPLTPEQKATTGAAQRVTPGTPVAEDPSLKGLKTPPIQLPEGVQPNGNQGDTATTTVTGRFRYRHADTTLQPAYGTQAEVWDQDSWSGDDFCGAAVCDWSGNFSVTFDNNQDGGLESGTADVYLVWRTTNGVVQVHDNGGNVFSVGTGVLWNNIGGGTFDAGGWYIDFGTAGVSDSSERAYQIQVYMSQAWAFSYYDLGFNPHYTYCQWYMGSTDGTYYSTGQDRIHLSQDDHNSPDVIMHEYGHSHMDATYSENYIPGSGGSHWFTGHYNTALAMSEGYATYYACASQGAEPWYDDNNPGNLIHWNCEDNHDGYGAADGNVNNLGYGYDTESAVLAMLLDLYDSNNSPTDPYDWSSGNHGVIFDVMRNYLPGGHHPYSIQEFYDGWKSRGWGAVPKLNGQMQVHGMPQGIGNPTLGISAGLYRYGGTWYWNGYGRGSFDVKNYGSQSYAHQGFYVWLRYPDGSDAYGLAYVGGTSPIASGATQNVWSPQDHIANSNRVIGTYSLTAGHWRSDGNWQVLEPAESGTTNYITVPVVADTDEADYCNVTLLDGPVQNNSTQVRIRADANDYDSAIAGYWTEVGTSPGSGDEQGWVYHAAYNVTSWTYTITGLSMNANTNYYVTVVVRNVEGYDKWGYSSAFIAWDATPPGAVTVTDDGVDTYDLTQLHFKATSSEPDGAIYSYWTRIGTYAGGGDIEDWQQYVVGDVDSFEHTTTGLSLVDGTKYFITVVARNVSGQDTWGDSDGITARLGKTVSGHVELQDWTASPAGAWMLFLVRDPGSLGYVEYHYAMLDASGNYSFGTGLSGYYDVTAVGYHWLQQRKHSVHFTGSNISGVNFSLINGDVDGDNAITVFDYNLMSDAFDSIPGDANWNWYADLDGDGAVTVFDYNILSTNFDMVGDD